MTAGGDYNNVHDSAHYLLDKYPSLFGSNSQISPKYGWLHILDSLCYSILARQNHVESQRGLLLASNPYNIKIPDAVNPVVIQCIKEKFGELRFYYNGGDDIINGMVRMAETWSSYTCEKCGNLGHQRDDIGWVKTLCDHHYKEAKK